LSFGPITKSQLYKKFELIRENLINNGDLRDFPLIAFVVTFIAWRAAGKYISTITRP
jgi:hypothetical protein